ncbi:MAG: hypothetical protein EOP49_30000, partial [Sphingobacteriales bacterium]
LQDTDGDGKADKREILLSGFDDHDTHHNIHAFTTDPSGAIYMGEGVFLHTDVETSYGPVRATNGGFYRYSPQLRKLERTAQPYVPNPWGIAFDYWGQNFYAETSSPDVRWMMPASVKPRYGVETPASRDLLQPEHRVRPTSGLEFVSSRHFPDEWQGDFLINNTIGFLGTKQHTLTDEGTGYKSRHRQDLLVSTDKNFRPVAMQFAPDGSLYLADWHNILIGHMQHNARDPLRDHVHGRIYRVTYPSRPLVVPAKVHGASISTLLDNLKLPEYRTRYRTRAELRGRKASEVLPQIKSWVAALDKNDPKYEHHVLEALWVSWGLNKVDRPLLLQMLKAKDYHARAAAVRVLRYTGHQISDQPSLLMAAASDPHGRVRLEAIVAASWLPSEIGLAILEEAGKHEIVFKFEPASYSNGQKLIYAGNILFFLALAGGILNNITPGIFFSGLALALLSSAIPFTLEMKALRKIPAKTFSVLMSLEPAAGALSGLIFLHEYLSVFEWLAVFLVVIASAGATLTGKKQEQAMPEC